MNQPLTMYGIKNCDTIKKAKNYLEQHSIGYQFHDYRVDGISQEMMQTFVDHLGCQALLNTRGTTWRKLSDDEKQQALSDPQQAIQLMIAQPAIIKRPLLVMNNQMLLGFNATEYQQFLSDAS